MLLFSLHFIIDFNSLSSYKNFFNIQTQFSIFIGRKILKYYFIIYESCKENYLKSLKKKKNCTSYKKCLSMDGIRDLAEFPFVQPILPALVEGRPPQKIPRYYSAAQLAAA